MIVTAPKIPENDGFTTQHCKVCDNVFKVLFNGANKLPIAHCPYCNSGGQYWTIPDQTDYLEQVARQYPAAAPPPNPPHDPGYKFDYTHNFTCHHDVIKVQKNNLQPAPNNRKYIYCIVGGEQFVINPKRGRHRRIKGKAGAKVSTK